MKEKEEYIRGTIPTGKFHLVFEGIESIGVRKKLQKLWGKDLDVTLKEIEYIRSLAANRYYWKCVIEVIQEHILHTQGEQHTKTELHAYNLINIAGYKPVLKKIRGIEVVVMEGKTSSEMTDDEFNHYVEAVKVHWIEHFGGEDIFPEPKGNNTLSDHAYTSNTNKKAN